MTPLDNSESWKQLGYERQPNRIEQDEDGHQKWYYLILVGGTDEEGTFEYVLDGPAQGEKAYV